METMLVYLIDQLNTYLVLQLLYFCLVLLLQRPCYVKKRGRSCLNRCLKVLSSICCDTNRILPDQYLHLIYFTLRPFQSMQLVSHLSEVIGTESRWTYNPFLFLVNLIAVRRVNIISAGAHHSQRSRSARKQYYASRRPSIHLRSTMVQFSEPEPDW